MVISLNKFNLYYFKVFWLISVNISEKVRCLSYFHCCTIQIRVYPSHRKYIFFPSFCLFLSLFCSFTTAHSFVLSFFPIINFITSFLHISFFLHSFLLSFLLSTFCLFLFHISFLPFYCQVLLSPRSFL